MQDKEEMKKLSKDHSVIKMKLQEKIKSAEEVQEAENSVPDTKVALSLIKIIQRLHLVLMVMDQIKIMLRNTMTCA